MKTLLLQRNESTDQGTVGTLLFGSETCRTLELPWRDNKQQLSCIPPGSYDLVWAKSPKFGMCYHLVHVHMRANVLIHSANFAGDSKLGWTTQLQGCIAPCTRLGFMKNLQGKMQLAGLVSKPALRRFESWGNKELLKLEILS